MHNGIITQGMDKVLIYQLSWGKRSVKGRCKEMLVTINFVTLKTLTISIAQKPSINI